MIPGEPEPSRARSSSSSTPSSARRPARTRSTRSTATAPIVDGWPVDGRRRRRRPAAARAARPRRGGARRRRRRRRRGLGLGRDLALGPGRRRLVDGDGDDRSPPTTNARRATRSDQGPILNLADYQSIGDIARHRRPRRVQGRADAERGRQPARRQPEPPVQPRRAGLGPDADAAPAASRPATRARPTTSSSSRRRRSPASADGRRAPGAGRHRPLQPARLRARRASSPRGWPKFTGGWMQATPAVGDADGDGDLDVTTLTREGWSFLWEHRARRRLRRLQRRVVDLPPRRALDRQLRHRRPPAGHRPRSARRRGAAGDGRACAGPRPATTGSAARPTATGCSSRRARSTRPATAAWSRESDAGRRRRRAPRRSR